MVSDRTDFLTSMERGIPSDFAFSLIVSFSSLVTRILITSVRFILISIFNFREPIFTGGIEIPANTIFFGTAELGSSRLRIKVSNIRYGSYIAPVNYIIYDSDAIEGLNLPSSLKAEATQRIKQGLVQNIQMPISSIGTMASEVTSAISATTQIAKQVIGQSLSQIKVELKANYNLFLKEETQEDMKKREAEDAELEKLYQQMLLQKNEPKKKNYLKKIFDSL